MGEEIRDKAFEDYRKGMKYKEIAEKYGVSLSAVKSWASRYWKKDGCNQKEEKLQPEKKKVATRGAQPGKRNAVADEVNEVLDNPELTDKQRLFCLYYVRCFNATKSYQKAFEVDYATALVAGPRLLGNVRIKKEIQSLKQNRLNRELLSEHDIFQKYMDIAFADITDYVSFGTKEIQFTDKAGNAREAEVPFVGLKESVEVDGTLLTEISQGKDGIKIKLADRMKALDWLSGHMGMATPEQKARLEQIKAQTARLSLEPGDGGKKDIAKAWAEKILESRRKQDE